MHSINRCAVRIGSAGVLSTLALLLFAQAALAQALPNVIFAGQPMHFVRAFAQKGDVAVALSDPALQALLVRAGATVTWQHGERYILITTAEPRIVSFSLGDERYDSGDVSARAAFAPFERGNDAYLPLFAVARALYLEPKQDGNATVLQPQIALADIQSRGGAATLILHGALPLRASNVMRSGNRVAYEFPGFGSTLARSRDLAGSPVRQLLVETGGSVRAPSTRVTLLLNAGASADAGTAGAYHDFAVSLNGAGTRSAQPVAVAPVQASASPSPAASPAATASTQQPARVTAVDALQSADGFDVQITVEGDATYEWHRLLDNRWYVDIHDATLQAPQGDRAQTAPSVSSLRVRQMPNAVVRIALTLAGNNQVDVSPSAHGLNVSVKDAESDAPVRTGSGTLGANVSAYNGASPAPPSSDQWKFSPSPSAPGSANPKLIVIDPGHGGSDPGSAHGGLSEKTVTLDISRRLRAILIARGWEVQMTRTSDVDVYSANDSAREELQARDDVANRAGARLFVSVHANSFAGSGPSGTTTYFYKAADRAFADAVHRRLASANLGTKDDGVLKNNFYVLVHSNMPAVLIESAFLSNPGDFELLSSPAWLQKIATAIADGIGDYAGSPAADAQSGQR